MDQIDTDNFDNIKMELKHFFSGAAGYVNGNIFMSLTPVGFALKLPMSIRDELLKQEGTNNLRYFPKGPIKEDYILLSNDMIGDPLILQQLVHSSIEYVSSLNMLKK